MEHFYHVLNRGVDKRKIFIDSQDFARFIHNLYEFNDISSIKNSGRIFARMSDIGCHSSGKSRNTLVQIHGWCLMDNHFHLILWPIVTNGISLFMQRVNIGYVKYFNEKYKRSGTLFQGKTKKVPIEDEAHFYHILHYIHLNPLDYLNGAKDWRERSIANTTKALEHIQRHRWSSYLDYCGVKNFPSILTKEVFGAEFPDYKAELRTYLKSIQNK